MKKARKGKYAEPIKHLGKSVGSSRKRNLKKIANKVLRIEGKKEITTLLEKTTKAP